MQRKSDEVIARIALAIHVIGERKVKTLDLGSPTNKQPIVITYYEPTVSPVVIDNIDEQIHREVFNTVLGSAMGKNNKLTFVPKPLVITIVNCPKLKDEGIDLQGGFAIITREKNPFAHEHIEPKKEEQKPKPRDPSPSTFLSTGFKGGWWTTPKPAATPTAATPKAASDKKSTLSP